jgi:hypothetical protein
MAANRPDTICAFRPLTMCGGSPGTTGGTTPATISELSLGTMLGTSPSVGTNPGPRSGIPSSSMSGIHPGGLSPSGSPCTAHGALSLITPGSVTRGIIASRLTARWSMPPVGPATTPAWTT